MSGGGRPNRLAGETSPYLLQHAHNPVDWRPWGAEALETARREDKPIFLSIGYAACHWCHVMERESFEDAAIAAYLNEHFVSIKVDREERPDIDEIYMNAVQLLTGSGGWPLTAFLAPDLRPFAGGTYFPPEDRWGRIGFRSVPSSCMNAAHSMGTITSATKSELDSVTMSVLGMKPMNSPTSPGQKIRGANAASVVIVAAMMGIATSPVAFFAAVTRSKPSSRNR